MRHGMPRVLGLALASALAGATAAQTYPTKPIRVIVPYMVVAPHTYRKLPYDPLKDFAPVAIAQ